MGAKQLEEWFDDHNIGDLEYVDRPGHDTSGYHIKDYEQKGYARYLLEENFWGQEWRSKDLDDDYVRHQHRTYDVTVEISDDEIWIYMPKAQKQVQEDELKAVLAGGPPTTPNPHRSKGNGVVFSPAVEDIDYIIDWIVN